jgi:hypothetical protein
MTQRKRLQAVDVIFMRKTARFTLLNHKRNEVIKKTFTVESLSKFIQNYCVNCKNPIKREDSNRIPKKLLHYRPNRKRSLGRTLK